MRSVTSPCRAEGLSVPKLRVHDFSVSVDGYDAGPDQSLDNPLGVGGEQLHDWAFATKTFRRMGSIYAPNWSTRCIWRTCRYCCANGERLWDNLDEAPNGYEIAEFVGTPAALHVRLVRKV
jgi:hypothetical protein